MKKIWCFVLLALVLATGICMAEVPDLLGNWTGSWSGYNEENGYSNLTDNGRIILTVVEQQNRIFNGTITIKQGNETGRSKSFAGAIGVDSQTSGGAPAQQSCGACKAPPH